METALPIINLILLVAVLVLAFLQFKRPSQGDTPAMLQRLDGFEKAQEKIERAVREEIARNRDESAKAASTQRQELMEAFRVFGGSVVQRVSEAGNVQKDQLETFSGHLTTFAKASGERLDAVRAESALGAKQLREEVVATLKGISETNMQKLESLRVAVDSKLQNIQADNAAKLEQMRATVEEKLQGTLDKRLGESFKQVSDRLEQVHKGLGEMQALATGVGDLKKVLTNVKTRGTWGEMQLGNLLDQILTPEQYAKNVATRKGSSELVEFAIRLPGSDDGEVWLPIDAKCPVEDYQRLVDAQERADAAAADEAGKQLENRIKGCAKDILEKYISPPSSTDFGIMYLPTEGLYAEVIRRPGLVDLLQRQYRVNVAGPTTLAALLNSLQMGFRTLAIQKRSSEVWTVLGAVKTEFGKFGDVLDKVHRKLEETTNTIDDAAKRTRAIERKLRNVEELPAPDAQNLLGSVDGVGPDSIEAEA